MATYKRWHGRKIKADHQQWKRARWTVEFVLKGRRVIKSVPEARTQAQAERARAVATLARAQATLRRLETLLKAGAISGDELEAAQTAFKSAEEAERATEFTVARAEHELQLARARLRP